jgi:RNA polymerase sigma factor (sigma-70 family)
METKLNKITVTDAQEILSSDRKFSIFVKKNSNFLNKLVWTYLRKNSLNDNDSEVFNDVMQEALLSLFQKALPKYNGSTKFSTFAYQVIKNDILAFLQKRSRFEADRGSMISLEKLKKNKGDEASMSGEYNESIFKNKNKYSFDDEVINRVDVENKKNKLSSIDHKIYEMRNRGWGRDKICQALDLNIHTYKMYLYGSYFPKMIKLGLESENAIK